MRKHRLWRSQECVVLDEIKEENTVDGIMDYSCISEQILACLELNGDILEIMHEVKYSL